MYWNKKADLLYYYEYVRKYSTIVDTFITQTKDSYPLFQYSDAQYVFNKYLKGNFAIRLDTGYNEIYKKYSEWLIARFISNDFLFNDVCPKYQLKRIKDTEKRSHYFLAKTIKYFLDDKLDSTDYKYFVAYKMYIGAKTIIFEAMYPDSSSMKEEIESFKEWTLEQIESNYITK